ncbi:MAG TPA: hypothetical protein VGL45_05765 [Bradyrhizobium sp.]
MQQGPRSPDFIEISDGALGPLHPPPSDFCLYNIGLYELGIDPGDVLPPIKPA